MFAVSAALSFGLTFATRADATVITVAGPGCYTTKVGSLITRYYCSVPVGTSFSVANLTGAYFDYWQSAKDTVWNTIEKVSDNGSYYYDTFIGPPGQDTSAAGRHETWVAASQVKTSASVWDYIDIFVQFNGNNGDSASFNGAGVLGQ